MNPPKPLEKKRLRVAKTHPHRWGPGMTHAMYYATDALWGRGWYPVCSLHWTHSAEAEKVPVKKMDEIVDCKKCRKVLASAV